MKSNITNSIISADENKDIILPHYRVTKEEGRKFYFGSDAHHPEYLANEKQNAETIIDLLEFEESDKFYL